MNIHARRASLVGSVGRSRDRVDGVRVHLASRPCPRYLVVQLSDTALPADGFSSTEVTIRSSNGHDLRGLQVLAASSHHVVLESLTIDGPAATASLRAGVLPGDTRLRVTAPGFASQEIAVETTPDTGDAVGDGTPDFLRLHDPADRLAFRHWFTLLAESQYYRGKSLPPEIDDCAALLRFAYREALREHDAAWAHGMAWPLPRRPAISSNISIPTRRWEQRCFACAAEASPKMIFATAPSRSSPMSPVCGGTTRFSSDEI